MRLNLKLSRFFGTSTAKDYSPFLSRVSSRRQPSAIRSLQPLLKIPGMLSLGGGLPNPTLFPFKGIKLTIDGGQEIALSQKEIDVALQYSPTPGLDDLVSQLKTMQTREHKPRYADWSLCVTTGSQDALAKAFEMLVDEGDEVLVEAPCYSGALSALLPLKPKIIEVQTDENGLIPESLEEALSKCKKPKCLYTVPTGQNPSGATLDEKRKAKIYELAVKRNFLILEDDPYYYLHYGAAKGPAIGQEDQWKRPISNSFWSMDSHGLVIRFDSFSKVLSSGLRLGVATGPQPLINRMELHTQAHTLHASGVSQMMVLKLLKHWGESGWDAHVRNVALFYLRRRDMFSALCSKHLGESGPKGLAQWTPPSAGMFIWFKLNNIQDTKSLIEEKARGAKVILVPGQSFSPLDKKSPYVRAAFSVATEAEADAALQRFATLLKQESRN